MVLSKSKVLKFDTKAHLFGILGGPMMMRYPPEMMPPMGPSGMMMQQRPVNMDPQMMPYPPSGRESTNEGDSTSP